MADFYSSNMLLNDGLKMFSAIKKPRITQGFLINNNQRKGFYKFKITLYKESKTLQR